MAQRNLRWQKMRGRNDRAVEDLLGKPVTHCDTLGASFDLAVNEQCHELDECDG